MEPEKADAKIIFGEALGLSVPAERAAYLDRACAGDPSLRQEVESLLGAYEKAGNFLDQTVAFPGPDMAFEGPGTRIGHYKLLEKIGEGGFGVVWMAEQEEPIRRRVALKIIKLGMDTREVVARFEAERQALAMMDHPNIATVFDGGATATGRPFFVMELVKGVPITEYCDANRLSTEERLQLFIQVCHALQHAHQKGVIHRDLKPSNILVTVRDERSVPKIIDFGVAKATQARLTQKSLFTRFHQRLGTPAYMSPEQADLSSLDVDTRSDIYSLGVLLYELLTGRTPFETEALLAAGYEAVMRTIREEDPPKPSTRLSTLAEEELRTVAAHRGTEPAKLGRLVRGDLDWIVMKALEKDRARRYETANGLAADIQRHLGDEPVLARPPSTAYRMQQAWRRNKMFFTAGVAVIASLLLGMAFSTWQAIRASKAEGLATQRLTEAEAISQFLIHAFQSPDPARDGRTITVAEILSVAAQQLETNLASQLGVKARLRLSLGRTYQALGLAREAVPLQEKARDYYWAASGPTHPDTLQAMNDLAFSYFDAGCREEALELREEVLTLTRKMRGREHPNTLAAMGNLALSYSDAGRREEALELREDGLRLSRQVNGPEDPNTLSAMIALARSYAEAARRDGALKLLEEVLPLLRKVDGPEHPDTLAAMNNLGASYAEAGRQEEALKAREELLPLVGKVNGPEHPDTISAMINLAHSYSEAGQPDKALKLQEEALSLLCKVGGPEHPDTLRAMSRLAALYSEVGRWDKVLKLEEDALSLLRKVRGQKHADTLLVMHNLAVSYFRAGRRDEARKLLEEALPLREVSGREDPDTLRAENSLAALYYLSERREEALKLLEEALPLLRKVNGPEHPEMLSAMRNLADFYYDTGRRYGFGEGVVKDMGEALTWLRKAAALNHPAAQSDLGSACFSGLGVEKDAGEAMIWWRKAAEQNYAAAQFNLGVCYQYGEGVARDYKEAVAWYRKAANQNHAEAQNNLGNCYLNARGVAKDEIETYKWWLLAGGQGLEVSKQSLAGLESQLTAEQRAEGQKRAAEFKPQVSSAQEGAADFNAPLQLLAGSAGFLRLTNEHIDFPQADILATAETGDAKAQNELGEAFYAAKQGVTRNPVEAVKWFIRSAEQNYAAAQFNLGVCYERGDGVAKYDVEAYKWYLLAAAQGHTNAKRNMSLLELMLSPEQVAEGKRRAQNWLEQHPERPTVIPFQKTSNGKPKDETSDNRTEVQVLAGSLDDWRKRAQEGDVPAQRQLGLMYLTGNGVEKDIKEGLKWIQQAAAQGDAVAQFNLGVGFCTGDGVPQNFEEAFKWFRKAADQGLMLAQFNVAAFYLNGLGISQNYTEAAAWMRKAASQGYAEAQHGLGQMCARGQGVELNLSEAITWYSKAAAQGLLEAERELGMAYLCGRGTNQDTKCGIRWLRKAADAGNADALRDLGMVHLTGMGVKEDHVEAAKFLRRAAQQNHGDAEYNLGVMYARGDAAEKNWAEALKLYHRAAEHGSHDAQLELAKMYSTGKGVEKNPAQALKWVGRAANQGDPEAQFGLAEMLRQGQGGPADIVEAYKWYSLASKQGSEKASGMMDMLTAEMKPAQVDEAVSRVGAFVPKQEEQPRHPSTIGLSTVQQKTR